MKKGCLVITLFFLSLSYLFAQRYADIGFITGASYYMGDINTSRHFYKPTFSIGGIYRYSLNYHHAFRAHGIYTGFKASGDDFSSTPNHLQGTQPALNARVIDMSVNWEFNFLQYRATDQRYIFTPYVTAGLGYALYLSNSIGKGNHVIFPFGIGLKYNLNDRLSTGLEWVFRKTFTDKIDGIENIGTPIYKPKWNNCDWYSFAGIFITYKFFKFAEKCPTYYDD